MDLAPRRKARRAGSAFGLVLLAALGCEPANRYAAPPPAEVTVSPPWKKGVTIYRTYSGVTRATETVSLRARVKGFIKEKHFKAGEDVKRGQLLIVIDEAPFQATLAQAEAKRAEAEASLTKAQQSKAREVAAAQLALDQAMLALARIEESRQRTLVSRNTSPQADLDRAEANRKKSEAQVDADKASLEQARTDYDVNILAARAALERARAEERAAKIDLEFCRISSPIDGRISRILVDVGNYVGDGQATELAQIFQEDPIYAYMSVGEDDLLMFRKQQRSGQRKDFRTDRIGLDLSMGDEADFPHPGRVEYVDPNVDPTTGTVQARGEFPNADRKIVSGLFVRVRVALEERPEALLIPETAIGSDQSGSFVLVVGAGDVVEKPRPVTLGSRVDDGFRVVEKGVTEADRIVIDGLQKARPGAKVKPVLKPLGAPEAPSASPPPTTSARREPRPPEPRADDRSASTMFSKFFIERPILANVIAYATVLLGVVALIGLPIEQYPQITPPTVQVSTVYPGADARVVADTVAGPIEDEVNGVEKMLYMSSTCAADGSYNLTVTFEVGTNLDMAQVLVQNRVAIAQPKLPNEVQRQGITTKKKSTSIIMVVALTSPKGTHDGLFLSNYASRAIKDELSRITGVGDINVFGSSNYGMRIWIDPEKLKARNLSTNDVLDAVREQNVQVAAGQLGQMPAPSAQAFQYSIRTLGRLVQPEEFGNIIIKSEPASAGTNSARLIRVKDVARVERGGQVYDQWCDVKGEVAAGMAIYQLPGANALSVAKAIRAKMEVLKKSFPDEDIAYSIPFNTTIFVEESIQEVYKTLYEAGILVLIVILVFLQDWRATLVPATTVPVTIIGAFAAMAALGFSVNMLTLFGLILAIGIVVDDAIVIVENAAHHIDHDHLPPKEATIKAMGEVIGPVIGITLVLMAVFLPTAFLGGITGQLYRQFALTIAATAFISAINAVTLKPAQCATYLRPSTGKKNAFYRGFNAVYDRIEAAYTAVVRRLVANVLPVMVVFLGLVALTGWWFNRLPAGFLPTEDQGYAVVGVQLPDAASQLRTRAVVNRIEDILRKTAGVHSWVMIGGNSILDSSVASNAATFYVVYDPYEERTSPELSQDSILGRLRGEFAKVQEAIVFAFPPPSIQGLGVAGGFQMELEDRGGAGLAQLQAITDEMLRDGNSQTALHALNSTFRSSVPQVYAQIDREKVKSLGIPLSEVFGTLQAALGSAYVNDFNYLERTYQVRVQADQRFRLTKDDIRRLEVRNRDGRMIPLGTVLTVEDRVGPQVITRYNKYPAAAINGEAAPGRSSGEALAIMEQMAESKLPNSMGYDWTGISFQEKRAGSQSIYVFALAVVLVYMVLAGQYESTLLPAAVLLVVPLALLGTVAAVAIRGMDVNIYTQIGIVLIIALASKNAILIVEFARELRAHGRSILDAATEAARSRFRPILMTSFAFILGIVPLLGARARAPRAARPWARRSSAG